MYKSTEYETNSAKETNEFIHLRSLCLQYVLQRCQDFQNNTGAAAFPSTCCFPVVPFHGVYISGCVACGPCYASCWPKMTIDCSANAFVIRLGWILHLNHFIIYVPYSCQCHLEAVSSVIHHTLSLAVVINIVMGWTFAVKLPGGREYRSPPGGSGHSIQESTEGRLSGVLGTRRTLQRCR